VRRRPEMTKKAGVANDLQMTPEQKKKVDQLNDAQIKDIDRNILENVSDQWTGVSRVVLTTMIERDEGVTGLPEVFYLERVQTLAREGLLDSSGDLSDMKSSQVRLPEKKKQQE
jgi:hypothetical protein